MGSSRKTVSPHQARIGELLDRLVAMKGDLSHRREAALGEVIEEVREMPREGIVEVMEKAIGRSKKRREQAVFVLSSLIDRPEVRDRIADWIHDEDPQWRAVMIQIVGQERLTALAPSLSDVIRDDPECRAWAIRAAAEILAPENLPALLERTEHADEVEGRALLWAFRRFGAEGARSFLRRWLDDERADVGDRVVAAWGLGTLGDERARCFLVEILYEEYGHKQPIIRAAQALSDLYGWPFYWGRDAIDQARARVEAAEVPGRPVDR